MSSHTRFEANRGTQPPPPFKSAIGGCCRHDMHARGFSSYVCYANVKSSRGGARNLRKEGQVPPVPFFSPFLSDSFFTAGLERTISTSAVCSDRPSESDAHYLGYLTKLARHQHCLQYVLNSAQTQDIVGLYIIR